MHVNNTTHIVALWVLHWAIVTTFAMGLLAIYTIYRLQIKGDTLSMAAPMIWDGPYQEEEKKR